MPRKPRTINIPSDFTLRLEAAHYIANLRGTSLVEIETDEYRFDDELYITEADFQVIIANSPEQYRTHLASIFYSAYAIGQLTLQGHEYPTYLNWKSRHFGATLDHAMPKSLYPELTFDVNNWQPLSVEANQAKGSMLDERAMAGRQQRRVSRLAEIDKLLSA